MKVDYVWTPLQTNSGCTQGSEAAEAMIVWGIKKLFWVFTIKFLVSWMKMLTFYKETGSRNLTQP